MNHSQQKITKDHSVPNNLHQLETVDWPPLLSEIDDPPKKLWCRGQAPNLNSPDATWLAVVGSRKLSTYGKRIITTLIESLAGHDVVIVSGLAIGADGVVHQAALKNNLPTVAFPGSGLDKKVLYPRTNVGLADKIIAAGGCLLSEYDHDQTAAKWTFPQRNRLMAGSCAATLVVEAAEKSGTLITARLAMEYNRDVLTVPGSIFSSGSRGPHRLIRDGATPITQISDLHEALNLKSLEPDTDNPLALPNLSPLATKLYAHIAAGTDSQNELLEKIGDDNSLSALTELELAGVIVISGGKINRLKT